MLLTPEQIDELELLCGVEVDRLMEDDLTADSMHGQVHDEALETLAARFDVNRDVLNAFVLLRANVHAFFQQCDSEEELDALLRYMRMRACVRRKKIQVSETAGVER